MARDAVLEALQAVEAYMTACGYFVGKPELAKQARAAIAAARQQKETNAMTTWENGDHIVFRIIDLIGRDVRGANACSTYYLTIDGNPKGKNKVTLYRDDLVAVHFNEVFENNSSEMYLSAQHARSTAALLKVADRFLPKPTTKMREFLKLDADASRYSIEVWKPDFS
jgi:hypothetical protein